jgi:hypothetical protein
VVQSPRIRITEETNIKPPFVRSSGPGLREREVVVACSFISTQIYAESVMAAEVKEPSCICY